MIKVRDGAIVHGESRKYGQCGCKSDPKASFETYGCALAAAVVTTFLTKDHATLLVIAELSALKISRQVIVIGISRDQRIFKRIQGLHCENGKVIQVLMQIWSILERV